MNTSRETRFEHYTKCLWFFLYYTYAQPLNQTISTQRTTNYQKSTPHTLYAVFIVESTTVIALYTLHAIDFLNNNK